MSAAGKIRQTRGMATSWANVASRAGISKEAAVSHKAQLPARDYSSQSQKVPIEDKSKEQMRHRGTDNGQNPLILSLRFSDPAFRILTSIRKENFPEKHNNLDAHLSILHALPASQQAEACNLIERITQERSAFNLSLGRLICRPKIIMLPVRSKHLDGLVYSIQEHFWDSLSDQDRQDFRGHITLCNKRPPEEISARESSIQEAVTDRNSWACKATGLDLWEYRGNKPWKPILQKDFKV